MREDVFLHPVLKLIGYAGVLSDCSRMIMLELESIADEASVPCLVLISRAQGRQELVGDECIAYLPKKIPVSCCPCIQKRHSPLFISHTYICERFITLLVYSSPKLALTFARHLFLNSFVSSLHNRAASTFAGLSSLGLLSILITLSSMVSGVWTGDHRSEADS